MQSPGYLGFASSRYLGFAIYGYSTSRICQPKQASLQAISALERC